MTLAATSTPVPSSSEAIGELWSALLELRVEVKKAGAPLDRAYRLPFDASFSAAGIGSVDVIDAGALSDDQVALAATYLAPCLAPAWAAEVERAITFGHVAQTVDGKIATLSGDSKWIGGIGNQTHAHRMRALCDAVLIGSRTLSTDAPKLNVRHVCGPDPVRVVIGSNVNVRALRACAPSPVIVVGSVAAGQEDVEILDVERDSTGRFEMRAVLTALYRRGIASVYVEGGAQTIERFLEEGVLDALQIHIAPIIVGDGRAAFPRPSVERLIDAQRLTDARFMRVDDGIMLVARCAGGASDDRARPSGRTREATSLWHHAGGRSTLLTSAICRAPAEWCEIETRFSAVSPGTERLVASGKVPPELHDDMRCAHMGGQFPYPVKYGYSIVGTVVDGPDGVVGRTVHAFHPHQDRAIVKVADVHFVPADVPMARATLAPNLETALNALWDSELTVGQRVLVVGFGIVGSLIARLASRIAAVEVHVLDAHPGKCALAAELGFHVVDAARSTAPGEYDIAFQASASGAGLQRAIDAVGFEGRVVDVSWYGSNPVTLCLGGSFHNQRKQIISSQVGSVATRMRARWPHARRMEAVMRLLADPVYDAHTTRTVDFSALPALFGESADGPSPSLSILVKY